MMRSSVVHGLAAKGLANSVQGGCVVCVIFSMWIFKSNAPVHLTVGLLITIILIGLYCSVVRDWFDREFRLLHTIVPLWWTASCGRHTLNFYFKNDERVIHFLLLANTSCIPTT